MTSRTQTLRQMVLDAPFEICMERAKFWTVSYKETEGMHPTIRAAKALEKTLDNMTIFILDKEQIVGHRTSKFLGAIIPVERGDANNVLRSDLKLLKNREHKPIKITPEDEDLYLNEIIPYWEGKTVADKKVKIYKKLGLLTKSSPQLLKLIKTFGWGKLKDTLKLLKGRVKGIKYLRKFLESNTPNLLCTALDDQGHLVMGHINLLKYGSFRKIKEKAIEKLNNSEFHRETTVETNGGTATVMMEKIDGLPEFQFVKAKSKAINVDNKAFLEAVVICCDATERFIKRFANLVNQKIKEIIDAERKEELKRISEICNWISTNEPKNFREAVQLVWFNEVIANISHGLGGIFAMGRPDQYLYPYYSKDIKEGTIAEEEVVEILEELLIKLCSNLLLLPAAVQGNAPELGADNTALTVGGVDKDGNDAVNELSYHFLEAIKNIKNMTIDFSIRISPKNPRKWIMQAIEILTKTSGPAFYNDDIIIKSQENCGCSLEDARDYAIVGCVEQAPQGNAFPITAGNAFSITTVFELTLFGGKTRLGQSSPLIEPFDSNKFKSYEEFWKKFREILKESVSVAVVCANIKDIVHAENYPNPFVSMTIDGCIDNALDMIQGGAKYNFNTLSTDGFATIANSLVALKKVVFEDREYTMEEFKEILIKDFKNNEKLRVRLYNKLPKFGNDDDYVDSIAQELSDAMFEEVNSAQTIRARRFSPVVYLELLQMVDWPVLLCLIHSHHQIIRKKKD